MARWNSFITIALSVSFVLLRPASSFSSVSSRISINTANSRSTPWLSRPFQTIKKHCPESKFQPHHSSSQRTQSLRTGAFLSSSAASNDLNSQQNENSTEKTPRSKLRQLTGFSLTALRSTLRAATGFSLTAFRTTIRAATGISLSQSISSILKTILSILPGGVRYFLQPLLILYYAPLLMLRYWVGPNRKYAEESRKGHEKLVDGWRKAVEAAENAQSGGYWPVHLNDDGTITASLPPDPNNKLDIADGIEKSVAASASSSPSLT
mmetsp:Transcript_31589/g.62930  ORF Transcript_31589/g.62930 Transcript_31589/m.62930 type:complete len:266 (+) Transcript_31589:96-893(+)